MRIVVSLTVLWSLLAPAAQAQDRASQPVQIAGDGCASTRRVDAEGLYQGRIDVRRGPGQGYEVIDQLRDGELVLACDDYGVWDAVIYPATGLTLDDCAVPPSGAQQRIYAGPCRSGWLRRRWLEPAAG